jgi:quinoprotein glucose dehydrogenase
VVGPPVITQINRNGKKHKVVISVTKSGNTLVLDRINGKLLNQSTYSENEVGKFINIKTPKPFSNNYFPESDLTNLSKDKHLYVAHKTRSANFSSFEEATQSRPIATFGIHGGAEWPGAAVNDKGEMVVTSNRYPWIIRKYFNVALIDAASELSNSLYMEKCSTCHKRNLSGFYINENRGDLFFPSLIGITRKIELADFIDVDKFNYLHSTAEIQAKKYIDFLRTYENDERLFIRVIKKIIKFLGNEALNHFISDAYKRNVKFQQQIDAYSLPIVDSIQLNEIYRDISILDKKIAQKNGFNDTSNYQLLLDQDGLPGSNPPWGYITSINLNTGKTNWVRPFGFETDRKSGKKYEGARNFGGAIITKSNLVFATGTTDNYARVYDLKNGDELWSNLLPYAGSSPPMTYKYRNCQYIIFNASGGKYVGFDSLGDATVAYKLSSCKSSQN